MTQTSATKHAADSLSMSTVSDRASDWLASDTKRDDWLELGNHMWENQSETA